MGLIKNHVVSLVGAPPHPAVPSTQQAHAGARGQQWVAGVAYTVQAASPRIARSYEVERAALCAEAQDCTHWGEASSPPKTDGGKCVCV